MRLDCFVIFITRNRGGAVWCPRTVRTTLTRIRDGSICIGIYKGLGQSDFSLRHAVPFEDDLEPAAW